MKRLITYVCLLAGCCALACTTRADVPSIINYQGRVIVEGTNFDGTGSFKFALVNPGVDISRTATAEAHLTATFVTSVDVTDGGAGYQTVPAVTLIGGGGAGAQAHAEIIGGIVSTIVVDNAGTGYSTAPAVSIEAPPVTISNMTYWSHDGTSTSGSEPVSGVAVPIDHGLYAVALGDTASWGMVPIPATVFEHEDVRLRVWFSDDGLEYEQLAPDQRIASVGYAMVATIVPASGIQGTLADDRLPANVAKLDEEAIFESGVVITQAVPSVLDIRHDGSVAERLEIAGHYAYVANHADGVRIYDIADPADIQSIGHAVNGTYSWDVAVGGSYAYVSTSEGLWVYNVSDPTQPVNVGHVDDATSGSGYGLVLAGNYVYMANYGDGLRVYDVSNPAAPVSVGHSDTGSVTSVDVVGDFAYAANFSEGMLVFDISNPTNPVPVAAQASGERGYAIAVAHNHAFLASYTNGLWVYDVSDPYNPTNVAHVSGAMRYRDIAVAGDYAYLADNSGHSAVYNISDPSFPVQVAQIEDQSGAGGVVVVGDVLYLGDDSGGLRTLSINGVRAPGAEVGALRAERIDCLSDLHADCVTLSGSLHFNGSATVNGGFGMIHLIPRADVPASPRRGDVYFDDGSNTLRCWDGSAWHSLW